MTENEIRELPPAVREQFHKVANHEIDQDPGVKLLLEELSGCEKEERLTLEKSNAVRTLSQVANDSLVEARAGLAAIEAERPNVVIQALIDGDGFEKDDELLERRQELMLKIDRLELALPQLEKLLKRDAQIHSMCVMRIESLNASLKEIRDRLKLQIAQMRVFG
ncbi:hypothetical protein AZSI13_31290 [Azospira sp. I13]|uniref:hypothetical protein n=1 Tax=Azospira sp. I13 TaxID=1765050 RepID=UPI000D41163E|nr:hypothetical protein [Azospira sp. I13]GBG03802.1 hypothetical protein AZSI13_31290 [Azospira sp. I13]